MSNGGFHNFFEAGPPVSGERFFGRKVFMRKFENFLKNGTSVIVVGERRIGKTSVLRQVRYLIAQQQNNPTNLNKPILIELLWQGVNTTQELTQEIARSLHSEIQKQLPDFTKTIDALISKETNFPTLLRYFKRFQEENYQLIIILDEVDALILDTEPQVAGLLRAIVNEGQAVIACTSFRDPVKLNTLTHYGSPWFNVFCIMPIGLFTDEESIELLTLQSNKSGREFTHTEISFLMDVFGNFPFYLQMAGSYIFNDYRFVSYPQENRMRFLKEAVTAASRQLDFHFPYIVDHLAAEQLNLVLRVARGKSVSQSRELDELQVRGIVIKNQKGEYHIFSRVFEEYLKELPEPTIIEKAKDSKTWKKISSTGSTIIDTALHKAIEIAAEKYL